MLLRLDRTSGVPVYRQVQDQVRFLVTSGALAAGVELPSTRVLAADLGLNPMTVSKAYAQLEREGVLERRPGRALAVRPRSAPQRQAARRYELEAELGSAVFVARRRGFSVEEALEVFGVLLEADEGGSSRT